MKSLKLTVTSKDEDGDTQQPLKNVSKMGGSLYKQHPQMLKALN